MVEEKLTKKQIIPMIVGVLTMVLLVSSATYAYFSITAGNTSGTTTITGDIGGDTLGTVTLSGGNTELYLGVSADDMSETNKGKVYYSSTEEDSRETNVNAAGKTTYTATLSGDDTDEVMYACDYEFTITASGNAFDDIPAYDNYEIELVFNGDIKDTVKLDGNHKVSGTWYGFKNSNKERSFNAYLQLTNLAVEQNYLAGTNLSVEIENTKWKCYLSELDELVGEAYALIVKSDFDTEANVQYYDWIFVRSETPYKVGDVYNNQEIVWIDSDFENSESTNWFDDIERDKYHTNIVKIKFEDAIRPVNLEHWFAHMPYLEYIDLDLLDTSLTTNVSNMFYDSGWDNLDGSGNAYVIGLENFKFLKLTDMSNMFSNAYLAFTNDLSLWDTSNITNMSRMFASAYFDEACDIDLSGWDVSNVTNMSYMFAGYSGESVGDISNWDVSNVTDMSNMFLSNTLTYVGNIAKWDTSNVNDMTQMFTDEIDYFSLLTLDLSGWNVEKVSINNHYPFSEGTNVIPPKWSTAN